jgi:peptide/nickel transport system permease protein
MKRRLPSLGLVLVAAFASIAIVGPLLAPFDPRAIDLAHELEPPSARHLLGTGDNGVDLLSAMLHGARLAGLVGVAVVGITLVVGSLLGAIAGYFGGNTDHAVSGLSDLLQAFPGILLNVAILALVARPGLGHLVIALSVSAWVVYARLARAQALVVREREFVVAARALGASETAILLRHVIPNLSGPLVVQATTAFGGVVLAESTLSFLGLGPGAEISWGALLDQGTAVMLRVPHATLVPATAIALTVLGFHRTGDWLRDRLDTRA